MQPSEFGLSLEQTFNRHGFSLTPMQLNQFVAYWGVLKQWNSRMNLTAVRDDLDIIVKHFLDSLSVLQYFSIAPGDLVIDIGSGAGFPGLPIKIYQPEIQLVLVESVLKKAGFLRFAVSQLRTSAPFGSICVIAQRAEACAKQSEHVGAYDWVLTRYVASLKDSMTYCLPLLKPGGVWIAYKSDPVKTEIQAATAELESVGASAQLITNTRIAKLNRTYVAVRLQGALLDV